MISVSVNSSAQLGATPLYMASQCDHCDIVQLLLDCGANVNEQTEVKLTHVISKCAYKISAF